MTTDERPLAVARADDGPEIFHSIQGEGPCAGRPSVFIRLSLCNLACVWCDTDYTWNWEGTAFPHRRDGEPGYAKFRKDREILHLTPAEIAARAAAFPCPSVVVTGGEPLVQQALLPPLLERLRAAGRTVDFETNGTIAPSAAVDGLTDLWVVSPKLENSGLPPANRIKPEALDWFARCSRASFKFVVGAPGDLDEVVAITARHGIPAGRVWLMPEGTKEDDLRRARPWVIARCLDLGMHYSDRLHVVAFGSRRGV